MNREYIGVYSRPNASRGKTYFFVWTKDNQYSVQKLDATFSPIDILKTIDERSFKSLFTFEPEIKRAPGKQKLVEKKTSIPAQQSVTVEATLRDHFRVTMLRLRRQDTRDAALLSLRSLAEVEEGIVPAHKHMFSDFGTELRKGKYLEQALTFCQRTLQLAPTDDHAHFNAARVLIEMGKFDEAEQHILTAQVMDPQNTIYDKTLRHIDTLRNRGNRKQPKEVVVDFSAEDFNI